MRRKTRRRLELELEQAVSLASPVLLVFCGGLNCSAASLILQDIGVSVNGTQPFIEQSLIPPIQALPRFNPIRGPSPPSPAFLANDGEIPPAPPQPANTNLANKHALTSRY